MDTSSIRARLHAQGWKILEIPVKRNHPDPVQRVIVRWRLVASRGEQSLEVNGPTIDAAMRNLGVTLGVIAKE